MERGVWQAIVLGVERVEHDLVTKPPPFHATSKMMHLRINKSLILCFITKNNLQSISWLLG